MTKNQIAYQELVERRRSNQASEIETNRSNLTRERETERSNRRNEELTQARDKETARSNLAKEFETNRSNLAKELETNRSNKAREIETHRSNIANEYLKRYSADKQAATSKEVANINAQASKYGADQRYRGTIDSAYIREYGVDPTTVVNAGKKVVETVSKPQVVGAAARAVTTPVKAGVTILQAPKVALDVATSGLAREIQKHLKGGSK